MRILIVTSCTGEKKFSPDNQFTQVDFQNIHDADEFRKREETLQEYCLPAEEMYTGQQHLRLLRGVKEVREKHGHDAVKIWIVSAGYGLIPGDRKIVPYEVTFQGMKAKELASWSAHLAIPSAMRDVLSQSFDLGLVLLGDSYLKACALDADIQMGGPTLFFFGSVAEKKFPAIESTRGVVLTTSEAKRFSCGLVGLKGEIAARLLPKINSRPDALTDFFEPTVNVLDLLDEGPRESQSKKPFVRPNPTIDRVIRIPDSWRHKPHRKKMRYFIPEWDDLVNPLYDFLTDTGPDGTSDKYEFAHYAHQIYDTPQYDGILVSKVIIEKKKKKKAFVESLGIHRYLRVPRNFPIMGDCGAFGYIMEDVPPYETGEILDYYQKFDFDYGVSIDHLIVNAVLKRDVHFLVGKDGNRQAIPEEEFEKLEEKGTREIKSLRRQLKLFEEGPFLFRQETLDENERSRRYEITINNARDFIEGHRKGNYRFTPMGAVQGWSPESYADAVNEYQKMGYTYLALGGLVRTHTKGILEVLREVAKVLKPDVDLHLFGVARPDALPEMNRLGVTSIDSATFLRRAWLGASSNYITPKEKYAAIRIPQAEKSPRAKKMVREGKISLEEVKVLEEKCLRLIRAYDKDQASIDDVFEAVMTYDGLMGGNRTGHDKLIRKTLEMRPWKNCDCEICKEHGVEVIIFRGNNRNRRRGFHNTKIFYDQLCRMFGEQ
jgi:hypothetical protein